MFHNVMSVAGLQPTTPQQHHRLPRVDLCQHANADIRGGGLVHATHVVTGGGSRSRGFRLVGNHSFGGEEQCGDGGGVLQGRAGNLHRVIDAGFEQVLVDTGGSVETVATGEAADLLGHDARLQARVERNLLQRGGEGRLDDLGTGQLVVFQIKILDGGLALHECDTTTSNDAFFNGSLSVADSVLNAVLAFLQLDLSSGTGLDDGNATGQLSEALLQLLTVVVRVSGSDLRLDLVNAAFDGLGGAGTVNNGGLFLGCLLYTSDAADE